jgi:hydrogenase maturation protease
VTPPGPVELALALEGRLQGAQRVAVVGVGDELSPLDCLGLQTAREIEGLRLPGIMVVLAGLLPESMTGPLRLFRPDVVIFLDAAEMGVHPGTIAIIDQGEIRAALFSVHVLPLSVVMEFVERDLGTKVLLLGIQPDTARDDVLSPPDREIFERYQEVLFRVLRALQLREPGEVAPDGDPGPGGAIQGRD